MRTHLSISFLLVIGALALSIHPSRVNPPVEPARTIQSALDPPHEVMRILDRSCADCHSNRTVWPWYSRVQPMASLIGRDVEQGRAAMNFSEWPAGAKGAGFLLAACAAMDAGVMPKKPYRMMHPDKAPTREDIRVVCSWSREQAQRQMTLRRRAEGAGQ
ncbi:MAG: heme-binding domain-containing protein [Acidobacteria bacterium]|nr:heme-binding domain-containing protein [Acidobacteriota bacterium]